MNQTIQKGLSKVIHLTNVEKRALIEKYKDKVFDGNVLAQKIRAVLRERISLKSKIMNPSKMQS